MDDSLYEESVLDCVIYNYYCDLRGRLDTVSQTQYETLLNYLTPVYIHKGIYVYKPNDSIGASLIHLISGKIQLDNEANISMKTVKAGDWFGGYSCIDEVTTHYAYALEDCVGIALTGNAIKKMLKKEPMLGHSLQTLIRNLVCSVIFCYFLDSLRHEDAA